MGCVEMAKRFRIEVVTAPSSDYGESYLQECLDLIAYNEVLKSITPYAETGGWTTRYVVVIELRT